MEEIRDDVVFYLETTTEELITIKPQPRIAKETTSDVLNQTSTTSLGSFCIQYEVQLRESYLRDFFRKK